MTLVDFQDYIRYWGNYFDWLVFCGGIVTLALYNTSEAWGEDVGEGLRLIKLFGLINLGVVLSLLIVRYFITIFRVIILIQRQRNMYTVKASARIGLLIDEAYSLCRMDARRD